MRHGLLRVARSISGLPRRNLCTSLSSSRGVFDRRSPVKLHDGWSSVQIARHAVGPLPRFLSSTRPALAVRKYDNLDPFLFLNNANMQKWFESMVRFPRDLYDEDGKLDLLDPRVERMVSAFLKEIEGGQDYVDDNGVIRADDPKACEWATKVFGYDPSKPALGVEALKGHRLLHLHMAAASEKDSADPKKLRVQDYVPWLLACVKFPDDAYGPTGKLLYTHPDVVAAVKFVLDGLDFPPEAYENGKLKVNDAEVQRHFYRQMVYRDPQELGRRVDKIEERAITTDRNWTLTKEFADKHYKELNIPEELWDEKGHLKVHDPKYNDWVSTLDLPTEDQIQRELDVPPLPDSAYKWTHVPVSSTRGVLDFESPGVMDHLQEHFLWRPPVLAAMDRIYTDEQYGFPKEALDENGFVKADDPDAVQLVEEWLEDPKKVNHASKQLFNALPIEVVYDHSIDLDPDLGIDDPWDQFDDIRYDLHPYLEKQTLASLPPAPPVDPFAEVESYIKATELTGEVGSRPGPDEEDLIRENMMDTAGPWDRRLIQVNKTTKITKAGRKFRYSALVVIGNHRGLGGFAMGKSIDPRRAVVKAFERAKRRAVFFDLDAFGVLPHAVTGNFISSKVIITPSCIPFPRGMRVIRDIFEAIGLRHCIAKRIGSPNWHNVVRATFDALLKCQSTATRSKEKGYKDKPIKWAVPYIKYKTHLETQKKLDQRSTRSEA